MAEFLDLTEYTYLPPDQRDTDAQLVNIGWLGEELPFPTGPPSAALIEALTLLADDMQHIMRGYQQCVFCDIDAPIEVRASEMTRSVPLGMAEVHVTANDGTVFAAPTLIIHYIADHSYNPPEAFRKAVFEQLARVAD